MKLSCAARGAAIEQFMAAVEEEHAAMAATTAAYGDHQRHLLQASAGGGGTTASLASNLPTTMAAMGARIRALLAPVCNADLADAAKTTSAGCPAAEAALHACQISRSCAVRSASSRVDPERAGVIRRDRRRLQQRCGVVSRRHGGRRRGSLRRSHRHTHGAQTMLQLHQGVNYVPWPRACCRSNV